jgi:hypothetical protein
MQIRTQLIRSARFMVASLATGRLVNKLTWFTQNTYGVSSLA